MFAPVPNFSLYPFNTFGMRVKAAYFDVLQREEDVPHIKNQEAYGKGLLVLGGGSNILFTQDVDKWVLRNEIKGITLIKEDDQHAWLKVGAGVVWHSFVLHCIDQGYAGVENMSLIPGTVGAAPMQNIGAYGAEVKDVIDRVRYFDLERDTFVELENAQCRFGYRDSIFKQELKGKVLIASVTFRLNKQPVFNTSYGNIAQQLELMGVQDLSIKAVSDAVIAIRRSKLPDPLVTGNAGSFFKNPEVATAAYEQLKAIYGTMPGYRTDTGIKIPAAWLIEQCGWKGYRKDDYGVHHGQPLVLVNYGGATGKQIEGLSAEIIASVKEQFNIVLEREVQLV
ncbi:MAG: UDP-N-acetylmuramate dehydrogenase [Edaphocola sp.]